MYQAKHTAKAKMKQRKRSNSVFQAAGILMITMMLSRVLGFVRDIAVTGSFSVGAQTDAYLAAFTIPDLIYFALVGGALSSAFIPVFSGYLATKKEEDAYIVASTILNLVSIAALVLIAIGILFTPQLVRMLVKFTDETFELTVLLTRIMFAQSFFMCLAGISQGILQSYKEFAAPAFGAVVYNIAIIVIGLLLQQKLGIMAFTIGVVVGAALNLAMQIQAMVRYQFRYRLI
ncbi:MAG: lipid II flippase MurJ, partial [Peptococcaceae bacterium]